MRRVFLLSPARCEGARARMLLSDRATFDLARRIRSSGAPVGEVFSFLSGLYFRGKLTYSRHFESAPDTLPSMVITTDRGLIPLDAPVGHGDIRSFAAVDLAVADERYTAPLRRDAERLAAELGADGQVILLGSIATGKYVDSLAAIFGERLVFPSEFVGRGDMSRGGLLLRHARENRELEYQGVLGATRRGKRPPKLAPIR